MASSQRSYSQTYDSNGLHDFLVEPKKGNEQSKNQHQQPALVNNNDWLPFKPEHLQHKTSLH